mmetsp:Transcript_6135/g.15729  ORF Transcript_6135/g.15729 Transcript_6135/m.15729 type:complete len:538 (+) Transcript_6135:43-1656(+)
MGKAAQDKAQGKRQLTPCAVVASAKARAKVEGRPRPRWEELPAKPPARAKAKAAPDASSAAAVDASMGQAEPAARAKAKAAADASSGAGKKNANVRRRKREQEEESPLTKVIAAMLEKMPSELRQTLQQRVTSDFKAKLSVCSLCSGSELQHLIGESLFKQFGADGLYVTQCACESDPRKRSWINEMMMKGQPICIYKDIKDMCEEAAPCGTHGTACTILTGHAGEMLAIAGSSCKDLSRLSMAHKSKENILQGTSGSSATIFAGLLGFLENHDIKAWIGENVDEMSKESSGNRQFMMESLAAMGWVAETVRIESNKSGARTTRSRAWILAFSCERCQMSAPAARALIQKMVADIQQLQIDMLPLDDFLLDDCDDYVESYFESAVDKQEGSRDTPQQDTKWQASFLKALEKKHMVWSDCVVPKSLSSSKWHSSLSPREKATLAFEIKADPELTSVDVSQSAGWCGRGHDDVLQVLIPRHKTVLLGRRRQLLGIESLMLHGYPRGFLKWDQLAQGSFNDKSLKDLAGNSFQGFALQRF